MRSGLIGLGVVALLVSALGLAAHFWSPVGTRSLFLSAISPYLGTAAAFALLLFALARGRPGWAGVAASAAVVAGYALVQVPLYSAAAAPVTGPRLAVMTSNLDLGGADANALVAAVRRDRVGLLMLEELTPAERAALRTAGLDRVLPHSVTDPRPSAAGTGLWSRFPIRGAHVRRDLGFSMVIASIVVPGTPHPATAVALHVLGPVPQAGGWLADMRRLPGVLASLPTAAPVVVGGDFNATPDVAQFRRLLTGGYADATRQAGAGILPTYPADRAFPPLISIDHVLTRGAVATSAGTVEIPGSDHRALLATVRLDQSAGRATAPG